MISRFHTNDLFDINGTLNADFTHYLLIDTRENRDYVWGHIPNATSIPGAKLIDNLPKNHLTPLIIYDQDDKSTQAKAQFIDSLGYTTIITITQGWMGYTMTTKPIVDTLFFSHEKSILLICIIIVLCRGAIGMSSIINRGRVLTGIIGTLVIMMINPSISRTIAHAFEKNPIQDSIITHTPITTIHKRIINRVFYPHLPLTSYRWIDENTFFIVDPEGDWSLYTDIFNQKKITTIEVLITTNHGISLGIRHHHPSIPTKFWGPQIMVSKDIFLLDETNPLTLGSYQIIANHTHSSLTTYQIIYQGKSMGIFAGLLYTPHYWYQWSEITDLPIIQSMINTILDTKPRKILHHAESMGMRMTNHLDHRYDTHTKRHTLTYPMTNQLSDRAKRRKILSRQQAKIQPNPIISNNREILRQYRCIDMRDETIIKRYPQPGAWIITQTMFTNADDLLPPPQTTPGVMLLDTLAQWQSIFPLLRDKGYLHLINHVVITHPLFNDPTITNAQNDNQSEKNQEIEVSNNEERIQPHIVRITDENNNEEGTTSTIEAFVEAAQNNEHYMLIVSSVDQYAIIMAKIRLKNKKPIITVLYQ